MVKQYIIKKWDEISVVKALPVPGAKLASESGTQFSKQTSQADSREKGKVGETSTMEEWQSQK